MIAVRKEQPYKIATKYITLLGIFNFILLFAILLSYSLKIKTFYIIANLFHHFHIEVRIQFLNPLTFTLLLEFKFLLNFVSVSTSTAPLTWSLKQLRAFVSRTYIVYS